MNKLIKVAVIGSTGYVGLELVKLLSKHINVKIIFLGSDNLNIKSLSQVRDITEFKNLPDLQPNSSFKVSDVDYLFLALPHQVSNKFVKLYYDKLKIIDLSADFRFDNYNIYKKFYGDNHQCIEYLQNFVYALPEFYRKEIASSHNFAIPGCYPTSILLPLIPLLKENLIEDKNIIIDSKSGYSGAGKNFNLDNIKSNSDYNFYNYNTNSHRHIPEIKQELEKFSNNKKSINFLFNPHILPNFRGMMSTIYCNLKNNLTVEEVNRVYSKFEQMNPFFKIVDKEERLDFFSVQNTNYCKIKVFNDTQDQKLIIVSVIDNLIKGAAGQAVQCLNIAESFQETEALL